MANTNKITIHSIRGILEKDVLTGSNFPNWHRNLRIVLRQEHKLHVIDDPDPVEPGDDATVAQLTAYQKLCNEHEDVACLMLATMSPELQQQLDKMTAKDMMVHLMSRYQGNQRQDRIDTSKKLFACKQGPNAPVVPHVHEMLGYIDFLAKIGFPIPDECAIDLILHSLNGKYANFLMNFVLKESDPPLSELLGLLRSAEGTMRESSSKPILMVSSSKTKRRKRGKKNKKGSRSESAASDALKPKGGVKKDDKCYYCGKLGHWSRNCAKYLKERKAKGSGTSEEGIFVIEVNLSISSTWVLDTGCGSHICNNVQGLRRSRTLAKGEIDLRVGMEQRLLHLASALMIWFCPPGLVYL